MSDVTTESIAALLAELVYERWMDAAAIGEPMEHAGLEALVVLIDALRMSSSDPQTGATMMQAAIEALAETELFPPHQELQRKVETILSGGVVRRARDRRSVG